MIGHYLMFNRDCDAALQLYAKAFDGKILEKMRYGEMPPNPEFPIPEENKQLILHSRIAIEDIELQCADSDSPKETGTNMYITFTTTDADKFHQAWDSLKEEAQIFLDIQPSFFALLHGHLQDTFGVNWMFTLMEEEK